MFAVPTPAPAPAAPAPAPAAPALKDTLNLEISTPPLNNFFPPEYVLFKKDIFLLLQKKCAKK